MDLNIIYKNYENRGACISLIERIRWVDCPKCPYCESPKYATLKNEYRYHCATCNCSYSVTVGTIFHNSKLDLQKWFLLICYLLEANFNISSRNLASKVSINKDTACRVKQVIREAMYDSEQRKLILKINNKLSNKIYD